MSTSTLTNVPLQGNLLGNLPAVAKRRKPLKHLLVALLLSMLFFIIFCFMALHGFIVLLLSNPQTAAIVSNPFQEKGLQYENIVFPAIDHSTDLNGWYIPADQSKRTIVFSHGYGTNREEPWVKVYDLAQFAHRLNYNVILFDYGFASATHKTAATGGKTESRQLLGAVHYAKQRGAEQVLVWGFSMGAGTALQAALQTDEIDAMILDSMFLPEPDTIYHNIEQYIDLPRDLSVTMLRLFFPLLSGTGLQQIPYEQVKHTDYPMPILFIHGTRDDKAPYTIAEQIAANQTNPSSDVWIAEDALHEMIFQQNARQYLSRTASFLSGIH